VAGEIDYQDYQMALQFDQRISKMVVLPHLTRILIEKLDPQEKDRVLDVGTGTGRLGIALFNMIPKGFVAGIDSGYGMLKVAREKILRYKMDNFFIIRGRAEALPL
jgi:ubiquinone/menaquinone biosynthesis C-methylase UbiE